MTFHALAQSAYAQNSAVVADPKRMEYAVFARVTKMLAQISNSANTPTSQLASAVHDNRRLWISIAGLVADSSNQLPQDLRARLFYLSEFVSAHSQKVLNKEATVDALVEVNQVIMAGLNNKEVSI